MPVEENDKSIVLRLASGATAEIYLFGATVTSWKVEGKERLFVSSKSALDGSKAIRGGIPICFPIFGPPPPSPPEYAALQQHGYVRSQNWSLEHIIMDREEGISIRLSAPPPPAEFNHEYSLKYVVTLSPHQLSTDLHVVNTGKEDFKFQALLHSYLAVKDSKKIVVKGLGIGTEWQDKTDGLKVKVWDGSDLRITKEVDAVFRKVPGQEIVVLEDDGGSITIRFRGFEDSTVWNPQEKSGKNMIDMEENGWDRYICVEPGYVREFKILAPGEEFLGQQILTVPH
ncbi:hypothetical protein TREMEDRAFT_69533 [Tremella mesenterica DSM 1558]|uniref:uncharacterized protein n=1 Tax=Tremella mesenterica (strain ATCC 24925 / CBS 8224 / DSM 1558 / NBRC 9311 / NRRL Y-6157 / RJB 2259-6 / UBC 559-6) TaxID=578456 RepID=UPI0003F49B07|nr:uncharacterized protein TREMEDRAFT_69533 [Tremella mesenterica DSM 1558]EIW68037.1 hypothetical protein TREMEDRAFT_69533 [Tremella mesenterica DSM 1558]